jgi:glycine betaine/proline transport system substrate-binding protein
VRTNGVVRGRGAALILAAASVAASGMPAVAQDGEPVRLAVNPWVGSEANVAVVSHLLENELGYEVEVVEIDENLAWQGFETGEVDAILEVWGHEADRALYIDERGLAQDAGLLGVNGTIGWYVPGWMAEEYPDITNWENLNKYAELFRTSESGDKGQFLLGDPSYVSNDAALIENLELDYELVTGGSEAALIESFGQATTQRTPLLAYFYEPQWAWSQEPLLSDPLVRVNLPEWTEGCDAVPEEVACDYPAYPLWKAIRTEFAEAGGPAVELIRDFSWTNIDQATVSAYISNEGMSAEDAAARWVEENPDKVAAWLPAA